LVARYSCLTSIMVLYITNMNSADDLCCVRHELEARGFSLEWYDIGEAKIEGQTSESEIASLTVALAGKGYGVLRNPKELLVEQVKQIIKEVIFCAKFSELHHITGILSKRTGYNYRYLSRAFSHTVKITIEHYVIIQKVERVKSLLIAETPMPLSDIAFALNYSSVAHLSSQFKTIAGETIRSFRAMHGRPLHNHSGKRSLDAQGRALRGNMLRSRRAAHRIPGRAPIVQERPVRMVEVDS
jgi:AraC family transcriptional regulator